MEISQCLLKIIEKFHLNHFLFNISLNMFVNLTIKLIHGNISMFTENN